MVRTARWRRRYRYYAPETRPSAKIAARRQDRPDDKQCLLDSAISAPSIFAAAYDIPSFTTHRIAEPELP